VGGRREKKSSQPNQRRGEGFISIEKEREKSFIGEERLVPRARGEGGIVEEGKGRTILPIGGFLLPAKGVRTLIKLRGGIKTWRHDFT